MIGRSGWPQVVGAQRVVERRAEDRVDAHRADAQPAHLPDPAVVVVAGRGDLAGQVAGGGRAEVDPGPEARPEAVGRRRLDGRRRATRAGRRSPSTVICGGGAWPSSVPWPQPVSDEHERDGGDRAKTHWPLRSSARAGGLEALAGPGCYGARRWPHRGPGRRLDPGRGGGGARRDRRAAVPTWSRRRRCWATRSSGQVVMERGASATPGSSRRTCRWTPRRCAPTRRARRSRGTSRASATWWRAGAGRRRPLAAAERPHRRRQPGAGAASGAPRRSGRPSRTTGCTAAAPAT